MSEVKELENDKLTQDQILSKCGKKFGVNVLNVNENDTLDFIGIIGKNNFLKLVNDGVGICTACARLQKMKIDNDGDDDNDNLLDDCKFCDDGNIECFTDLTASGVIDFDYSDKNSGLTIIELNDFKKELRESIKIESKKNKDEIKEIRNKIHHEKKIAEQIVKNEINKIKINSKKKKEIKKDIENKMLKRIYAIEIDDIFFNAEKLKDLKMMIKNKFKDDYLKNKEFIDDNIIHVLV